MNKDKARRAAIGTLTVFVVAVFITAIAFTVTALWFNWHGREVQDSVASGFYGLFGAEFTITGAIQVAKMIRSFLEGRKKQNESEDDDDG